MSPLAELLRAAGAAFDQIGAPWYLVGAQAAKPRFDIALHDLDRRKLLHELVDAHLAAPGKLFRAFVSVVRQTDGQRRHRSILRNQLAGVQDA